MVNDGILSDRSGARLAQDKTKSRQLPSRFVVYAKFRHVRSGTVRPPDRFTLSTVSCFADVRSGSQAAIRACGLSQSFLPGDSPLIDGT
jgi:hypothetical protein